MRPVLEESTITDFICTRDQKPDLFLHLKGDVTAQTIVEIHSSPFEDATRKSVIVATDSLRLHRMCNGNIKTVTAFTFPKPPSVKTSQKHCVVKVAVSWEDFMIKYAMTPL